MKINRVYSNEKSFKKVNFDVPFSAVVAEASSESGDKDSRNGLGKTLLVKIINYCLGSSMPDDLKADELKEWVFSIEVEINGTIFDFSRSVAEQDTVRIAGPVEELNLTLNADGDNEYPLESFKAALGKTLFGLDLKLLKGKKNVPSYRALMSYFIRSDVTAYNDPFVYFARQKAWSKQVHNSYLLGLDWELATKMNQRKAKLDALETANKAFEDGAMNDFGGTLGELESEQITLQLKFDEMQARLKTFKVHEQYYDIQKSADEITKEIHKRLNTININEQVITKYSKDLSVEDTAGFSVEEMYRDAGVILPKEILRHIDDVKIFHNTITKDRTDYLKSEISKLNREILENKEAVAELSDRKAEMMQVLSSYGALDEHSVLQNEVNVQKAKVEDVKSRIARLTEVADLISKLRVELEDMARSLRKDYSERLPSLALAIQLFNENSEALYAQSGKLSINTSKGGYGFKVDIKRSKSDGVGSMKVFCYDLMLAEVWATVKKKPLPLIHDSKLFDGVDERQVAKALELAYEKANKHGFQYICTMNSDQVPYTKFTDGFTEKFEKSIKVHYSDNGDEGTLLGIQF